MKVAITTANGPLTTVDAEPKEGQTVLAFTAEIAAALDQSLADLKKEGVTLSLVDGLFRAPLTIEVYD